MLSPEKIQFIEEHSKDEISFCHGEKFNDLAIAQSYGAGVRLKVGALFVSSVTVGNCLYYSGNRLDISGYKYKQIFIDRKVEDYNDYTGFLKDRGFIYCFEKEEYVYEV